MKISKIQAGFSVIEVILAAAIFVTFATGAVVVVISGIDNNRLGSEMTIANQFNTEGMEAVRSIKNQSWTTFIAKADAGNTGVTNGSGTWVFNGTNNVFPSDTRFTRTINVTSAQRDVSGNIVSSGGVNDANTKKVIVATTWNFTAARPESVSFIQYLTNWEAGIIDNGLIVYNDGTTTPKYRLYSASGSFSSAYSTIAGSSGRFFTMRTSPTKTEAVVGYLNASGSLQIMCFNGTSWTNEWSVSVGGTGTTRRFDIAYETNTGDVMVVYSRGVAGTNTLAYRTKPGSSDCGTANWVSAVNFGTSSTATTGTVQWVKAARDPRSSSNNLSVIWADSNSDLGVNNWSGTAWATNAVTYKALEANLERVAASQDVESFDLVYESLSGNAMVVWGIATGGNGTNGARYSRCTGGVYTCSWTATASVPTVLDDIHNIDMSADPNTNRIVYAAIGDAGNDLTAAYWDGGAWTGYRSVVMDETTESPFAGSKLVSTSWLINGLTTKWILNYDDATGNGLGWYAATPGSAPVKQTDFNAAPAINDIRERYDADMGPFNQEQAVVTLTDSTRSIFAKRASMNAAGTITWTNVDGGASLGTTSAVPPQGFTFMYWRNQ